MRIAVEELPEEFRVAAPDDALAPRLTAGQVATLRRGLDARRGDAVLVLDAAGGYHLRVYRPTVGDRWQAAALDADFPPLDSERDGLRVLAVLTGVEARWS